MRRPAAQVGLHLSVRELLGQVGGIDDVLLSFTTAARAAAPV